ncbi:hypothetical protein [Thalassotalea castellviae]|uniref:Sporulation stage II protein D amidase enhancer LytB N-terminal domain-containing protein n=1 Tax=Thalassotalea castellviae TaxID=3075612 RepID=A0ABU3A530_9GAMM|nr:hypothetical protein [Thalassotalea sp. W431]MDT0605010.1 hypothetical protein [Thalassotalea sp. W431]
MNINIILIFLLVNILFSITSQAKSYEGLLPNDFLLKGIAENQVELLIELNENTKFSDVIYCDNYVISSLECIASKKDKKANFLLDLKLKQVFTISNNGKGISNANPIQKIFGYKLIQLLNNTSMNEDTLRNLKLSPENNYIQVPIIVNSSGTPDYCSGVPEVFPSSCSVHDSCYESGTSKGVCDDGFLENMLVEAQFLSGEDQEVYSALFIARAAYYHGVTHLDKAFINFCLATPGDFPECTSLLADFLKDNLQKTSETEGGVFTGSMSDGNMGGLQTGGYGGHYIHYTCELWQFPDGNGGHYVLERNCILTYP